MMRFFRVGYAWRDDLINRDGGATSLSSAPSDFRPMQKKHG